MQRDLNYIQQLREKETYAQMQHEQVRMLRLALPCADSS